MFTYRIKCKFQQCFTVNSSYNQYLSVDSFITNSMKYPNKCWHVKSTNPTLFYYLLYLIKKSLISPFSAQSFPTSFVFHMAPLSLLLHLLFFLLSIYSTHFYFYYLHVIFDLDLFSDLCWHSFLFLLIFVSHFVFEGFG